MNIINSLKTNCLMLVITLSVASIGTIHTRGGFHGGGTHNGSGHFGGYNHGGYGHGYYGGAGYGGAVAGGMLLGAGVGASVNSGNDNGGYEEAPMDFEPHGGYQPIDLDEENF